MQITTNQLTKQQKKQAIQLAEVCNKEDNLHQSPFLEQEWNYNLEIPCFFLYYKEKKLVSFLSLFLPNEQETEVSAYTSPAYRGRGYFSRLLKTAIQILKEYQITVLTFLTEAHNKNSFYLLKSLNAEYLYSEYIMELADKRRGEREKRKEVSDKPLSFLPVTAEDTAALSEIHADAFQVKLETSKEFLSFLKEKNIISYKLILENQIIGFCNAFYNSDVINLFSVCIRREFQGQGYGKQMLISFIEYLKTYRKKICLQVNSKNNSAVCLYKELGFAVNINFSYYSVEISNL